MANEINILKSDVYDAVYVNGVKVTEYKGGADAEDLLSSVLEILDKSVDKTLPIINTHEAEFDFNWDRIWVNGSGFVENWADIEAARNAA